MEKLISAIQDWPVLVQGAIGAGIFWLILLLGQKATSYLSNIARKHSKKKQESYLRNQLIRHQAFRAQNSLEKGSHFAVILLYRASRNVVIGLIWLSLGLTFDSILGVLGVVGFVGCLYYLFAALEIIKPFYSDGNIDEKITELQAKLNELENT